jgi:hypothetical protein
MEKTMSRKQKQSQFVRSRETETLATLTATYVALEAAVTEAHAAIEECLEKHNNLLNPKRARSLSQGEITRDNNQRKYDYVAAVRRERQAFGELCAAMDVMHPLLGTLRTKLEPAHCNDFEREERQTLQLNFIESCHLYKSALAALSQFSDMSYEWTLEAYLGEECKAAADWFAGVPALPPRIGVQGAYEAHVPAVILGRAMAAIDRYGNRHRCKADVGGFLGQVMYASDVEMANRGSLGIRLDDEDGRNEHFASSSVVRLLVEKGWSAYICQPRVPGLRVGLRDHKLQDRD